MTDKEQLAMDREAYKQGRSLRRGVDMGTHSLEACLSNIIEVDGANPYMLYGWKVEGLGLDESDPLGSHAECTETALVELMKTSEANGVLTEKLRRAEYQVRRRAPYGTYDALSKARKALHGYSHRDAPEIMKALSWAMTQSVGGEGENDA